MTETVDILGGVENGNFYFYFAYFSFGYDNLLQLYMYLVMNSESFLLCTAEFDILGISNSLNAN